MRTAVTILSAALLLSCGSDDQRSDTLAAWSAESRQGGVMMVGDSITNRWPDELRPCGAFNRGIDGDTTSGVLWRLWLIEQEQPDVVFLLIGINDIAQGHDERVEPNIRLIREELAASIPETRVVVLSILESDRLDQARIDAVNDQIEPDKMVTLASEYRPDGTHPNAEGYALLMEQLSILCDP